MVGCKNLSKPIFKLKSRDKNGFKYKLSMRPLPIVLNKLTPRVYSSLYHHSNKYKYILTLLTRLHSNHDIFETLDNISFILNLLKIYLLSLEQT